MKKGEIKLSSNTQKKGFEGKGKMVMKVITP
jgi:hypothetical protein